MKKQNLVSQDQEIPEGTQFPLVDHKYDSAAVDMTRKLTDENGIYPKDLDEFLNKRDIFVIRFLQSFVAGNIEKDFEQGHSLIEYYKFLRSNGESNSETQITVEEIIQLVGNFMYGMHLGNEMEDVNLSDFHLRMNLDPRTSKAGDFLAGVGDYSTIDGISLDRGALDLYAAKQVADSAGIELEDLLINLGIHEGTHYRVRNTIGELPSFDREDGRYPASDREFLAAAKQYAMGLHYYGEDSPLMKNFVTPLYSSALLLRKNL